MFPIACIAPHLRAANGGNVPPTPDVFVDSVGGSDSNSGRSAALPKQTLAAARAVMGDNEVMGLKRGGSFWRETLDLSGLTSPSVVAYGSGSPPRITGMDYVPGASWSVVIGYPSVYSTVVTPEGGGRLRVFSLTPTTPPAEPLLDQLTGVADLAACEATPGTFVRPPVDDNPATIYIHPMDGLPPAVSDVHYQVVVRRNCITGGDGCFVSGIETGEAQTNNGSVDFVGRTGCTAERVIGTNGIKHTLGSGDGEIRDSIAIGVDATTAAEPSNAAFVSFLNDGTGKSSYFRRCGVIGHGVGFNSDYISHGNPNPFDFVTIEQAWTVVTGSYGATPVDLNRGSYYEAPVLLPVGYGTSKMLMARSLSGDNAGNTVGSYSAELIEDSTILRWQVDEGNNNPAFRLNGTHAVEISHCSMYCQTSLVSGNATRWFGAVDPVNVLNMHHSVLFNGTDFMLLYNGQPYTGDYNVFIAGEPGETRPVLFNTYAHIATTLAVWQADSGQDANSVWLARADQARGNAYAFWLGVANDENDGPEDGDWRVNPGARVYDGADVAHIGTFADGTTPITQAGPQNHWNWNTRAVAAGPPVKFPIVPVSLDNARTYILDPEGWNFYPA